VDGEEGEQLAGLAEADADLAVHGGDPQRAEHADPDRPVSRAGVRICRGRSSWHRLGWQLVRHLRLSTRSGHDENQPELTG
jgi:hypothetical protein